MPHSDGQKILRAVRLIFFRSGKERGGEGGRKRGEAEGGRRQKNAHLVVALVLDQRRIYAFASSDYVVLC